MIQLIKKDILMLRKTLLFAIIYPAIFILSFQSMGSAAIFSMSVIAVTYILILTAVAYDNKNKSDILLNSLPIGRARIVLSRYLSIYVFSAIGIVYYFIFYILIKISGFPLKLYPVTFVEVFIVLFAATLLNSIYFPIFFKLGYIKSKIINFVLFFAVFFGISTAVSFIKDISKNGSDFSKFILSIIDTINSLSSFQIVICIFMIMIIIFAISYMLSMKFYKNREF